MDTVHPGEDDAVAAQGAAASSSSTTSSTSSADPPGPIPERPTFVRTSTAQQALEEEEEGNSEEDMESGDKPDRKGKRKQRRSSTASGPEEGSEVRTKPGSNVFSHVWNVAAAGVQVASGVLEAVKAKARSPGPSKTSSESSTPPKDNATSATGITLPQSSEEGEGDQSERHPGGNDLASARETSVNSQDPALRGNGSHRICLKIARPRVRRSRREVMMVPIWRTM